MKTLKERICRLLACAALLCGLPMTAHANCAVGGGGAPDYLSGNNMGFALQADDFTACSAYAVTGVSFWSLEAAGAYRGSISWSIVSTPGGTALASGTVSDVVRTSLGSHSGMDGYRNDFNFGAPLALADGTYWLILHNGSFGDMGDPNEFLWATTGANGSAAGMESFDGGATWSSNFSQHAFQVSAVPEPGPAAMLAVGLVLAGCLRRREQRSPVFVR